MRPEIVCELSCNHAGSLLNALRLVDAAKEAGADAIKLQTWTQDTMVLDRGYTVKSGPWKGRNLANLYHEAHTPWEWHEAIFRHASDIGIEAFSTPFDGKALQFLESLDCPRYKVASFEITDLELISAISNTGKPIIISTGMATAEEINRAWIPTRMGQVTLLKCTSAYPAKAEDANLLTMYDMRERWLCKVGLSDHTQGITVAIAAAALGADMIEKHLVLENTQTLDGAFSITPTELKALCEVAPIAAAARGQATYGPNESEAPQLALRRSLYFARDMKAGETVKIGDMCSARPAEGVSPARRLSLLGHRLEEDVKRGQPVGPYLTGG